MANLSSKSESASLSSGYADVKVERDSISDLEDLTEFTSEDFISKDFGYDFDTIDTHCSETCDSTSVMMAGFDNAGENVSETEQRHVSNNTAPKIPASKDALRSQADSYFSIEAPTLIPIKTENEASYDHSSLSLTSAYLSSLIVDKVKAEDDDSAGGGRLDKNDAHNDIASPHSTTSDCQPAQIFENIEQGSSLRLQLDVDEIMVAVKAGKWPPVRVTAEDLKARRQHRVMRYKEKRQKRSYQARVRYEVRKRNAEMRPRIKGRFVKLGSDEQAPCEESDVIMPYMATTVAV